MKSTFQTVLAIILSIELVAVIIKHGFVGLAISIVTALCILVWYLTLSD